MWQSHLSYHPRVGYTYTPGFKSRLPHESGGYLLRANAAGFRSNHEFVRERPRGVFRALLFGDSQTAGLGVGNAQRFSDLLEASLPGLQIYNYGLDGVGPDQQHLAYREFGDVDHDLLILAPYVDDVRRVNSRYLKFKNQAGEEVFFAKPYYETEDGELALRHIPVPKRPLTVATLPAGATPPPVGGAAYERGRLAVRMLLPHPGLRRAARNLGVTDLLQKLTGIQRAPDYDSPGNPGWLLLRRILERWIAESRTPVLLLPVPMWTFVEGTSDPTGYRDRYRQLAAATGCRLHDPLPDLLGYPAEERRAFRFKLDAHLSPKGHQAMAKSLRPVIERLMREAASGAALPPIRRA